MSMLISPVRYWYILISLNSTTEDFKTSHCALEPTNSLPPKAVWERAWAAISLQDWLACHAVGWFTYADFLPFPFLTLRSILVGILKRGRSTAFSANLHSGDFEVRIKKGGISRKYFYSDPFSKSGLKRIESSYHKWTLYEHAGSYFTFLVNNMPTWVTLQN